ncbi:MAG: alpha/beta fold hydrolase, partial [Gemmatimonadota bacterium]|nr:alpha/beta fold hydrolase [Gemmatimonadota bacterium]
PILVDVRAAGRSSPRPAVVVLHGFKGFKDWGMFPPLAERLAQAGFTAITPNLSGSGVDDAGEFTLPDRFGHNTFTAELQDARIIVEALTRGELGVAAPSTLGLVGHSRGGGVGVLLAAQDSRVRALVTWAAIASVERWPPDQRIHWRRTGRIEVRNARTGEVLPLYTDVLDDIEQNAASLEIEAAAAGITIPWLLIHGTDDESVRFSEAESLKGANSRKTTQLMPIKGGGHTFGATHPWQATAAPLDTVFDATLAWLASHLK